MFTSQSLRAVVKPGALVVREQRLDDVVHQLDVRGPLDATTLAELAARIDPALVKAARELRSRKGELIVAGAPADTAKRLAAFEVAHRPAQAANVDQAIMILK